MKFLKSPYIVQTHNKSLKQSQPFLHSKAVELATTVVLQQAPKSASHIFNSRWGSYVYLTIHKLSQLLVSKRLLICEPGELPQTSPFQVQKFLQSKMKKKNPAERYPFYNVPDKPIVTFKIHCLK